MRFPLLPILAPASSGGYSLSLGEGSRADKRLMGIRGDELAGASFPEIDPIGKEVTSRLH